MKCIGKKRKKRQNSGLKKPEKGEKNMKENNHSSDALAEDLIRSLVQMTCAELHIKTLIEKKSSEFDNAMIADGIELHERLREIEELERSLTDYTQLRREDMLTLYDLYGQKGNKDYWCLVKHLGAAMMTAFEAYQASDDPSLYDRYMRKNKLFIESLSAFIGTEITDCAACFGDMLKGRMED